MYSETILHRHLNDETALVPGVLKHCAITRRHPDYEDLAQTVRLYLVEVWQKTGGQPEQFHKEAFTYARCRLLDLLRQQVRTRGEMAAYTYLDDWDAAFFDPDQLALHEFLSQLSAFDLQICQLILNGESLLRVSEILQISRTTLYNRLRKLQTHAKVVFQVE